MTNREFFEKVIATVDDAELVEFSKTAIEKLNARNEKRKEQATKKSKENEPIKAEIMNYLTGKEKVLCAEIAKAVEISTQKCTALCRQLIDEGLITTEKVKVKNKGKQNAYTIV